MKLDRTDIIHAGLLLVLAAIIALLASCGTAAAPADRPSPAADTAQALRQIAPPAEAEAADWRAKASQAAEREALAAAAADAARAKADTAAQREAEARAIAERTLRAHYGALADDAAARAKAQRADLDARIAAADQLATQERERQAAESAAERASLAAQAEADRRARDRWLAGLAIAGSVAVAIILWRVGLPLRIAVGIPAATAAGAATLAAWSSVPWLPVALGWSLALGALLLLAALVALLVRQWRVYADHLDVAMPDAKAAADTASLASQPKWIRWIVSALLNRAAR